MKKLFYIIPILWTLVPFKIISQEAISVNLILNTDHGNSQTYDYKAIQTIHFKPPFRFEAKGNNTFRASIDPINLLPNPNPNDLLGGETNGLVGKISDQFDVSQVGQATYAIPIKSPPGTGGVEPQLSIVYNSSSKGGLLGWGFDLSGLSLINRAPSNLDIDGKVGLVNFSSTDNFMLDGQRLILIKSTNSTTYEYRTEKNSFSRIISSGGEKHNPSMFTVNSKDGMTYEYVSNTSQLKSVAATQNTLFWLLRKVSDSKGNYYTISYERDDVNGEYWPIRMDYTGNSNTGLKPYCSIRFSYQSNSYPDFAYIYGSKVQKSKLMNRIDIFSGEKNIKYYQLSYQVTNRKYQLSTITEYAPDGTKINPTKFAWHNALDYKSVQAEYNQTSYIKDANLHIGDFNGDGKMDILATPKSNANWSGWRLFLSEGNYMRYVGSGNFALSGEIQQVVVGDFNGDGYTDFIVRRKYDNKWYNSDLYLASVSGNSVSFSFQRCFNSEQRSYDLRTGDFNGDGVTDIFLYYHNSKDCKIIRSEFSGNTVLPLNYAATRNSSINWDRVETVDFNGDGLTDIMNLNSDGYVLLESDGYGTMSETRKASWPNKEHHIYFGDFNGDSKTDMLLTGWNKDPNSGGWADWNIQFSTGTGFERRDISKQFNSKDKVIYVADIDGDGKDDFYAVDKAPATTNLSAVYSYINDGSGFSFTGYKGASTYGLDKWVYYLGDFNGDGKTDFLCTSNWNKSNWTGYQSYLMPNEQDRLLASVTDGFGNTTEISYKSMSEKSLHERGTTTSYPLTSFSSSWYLVDKVLKSNGIGGKFTTSYKYKNALVHKRGKGMLGFEYFTVKDETNNIETTSRFEVNTTQYIPSLKSTETKVNEKLLSKNEFANSLKYYYSSYTYNKIFTYDLVASKEQKYDLNTNMLYSTLESSIKYDDYGNVTQSVLTYDNSETVTNTNKYLNDEDKWRIGLITESVVTKKRGNETITRTSLFDYNPNSNLLIKETIEPNDNKFGVVKTYGHDSYGNIIETKMTPNDSKYSVRTLKSQYDSFGRFEIETTDYLGFVTKSDMDQESGLMKSITDANGMKTEYIYDSFGQLLITKTPLGNTQSVLRWNKGHNDAPTNAKYYTYAESSGTPPTIEFFDGLGRSLRKVIIGFNNQKIYTDAVYDAKGQVEKMSEPYFTGQAIYWSSAEYDLLGRVIKQTSSDGTSTSIQYGGLITTSTNPLGQKNIEKIDNQGRIIENIDNLNGTVKYEYNVAGNCIKVVGPRTTILSEYDKMGNKIKLIDPDLGTVIYDYNVYGELVSQKDNNGTTTLEYDNAGRLKKETSKDGIISYIYDLQRKGTLSKTTSSNNNISRTLKYDSFGRIIETSETIDDKTYITQSTYDVYNRIDKITYPSKFIVQHEYNSNGYLVKVKNPQNGKNYWEAKAINAKGQMELFTLGNNLSTTVKYDAKKGYITDISTPGIQNWSYKFNSIGNLTDRIDNTKKLTEHFDYDGLNRLWKVSHNGQLKQETLYDAAGNITSKTGVGNNFEYYANSNRLKSISGGNYTTANWDTINYTSFNKISYIRQGTSDLRLIYGVNKERKKATSIHNGIAETKYYVGSIYEEQYLNGGEIKKIHYIFANGGAIAINEQSSKQAEKLLYLHKDHLGSIQAYSDESGKLAGDELSYDAWGRRRNANNWQYYTALTDANTLHPRGFTGHEHLDIFEMINMNGRMYDPVIGRFLSPDPFVQAPDFTQGLNRYSYCMNNPLSFVDPSGYSWLGNHWKSLLSGAIGVAASFIPGGQGLGAALIAGAIGGASAGLAGALLNGANFEVIAKSTLGGAFSGALGGLAGAIGGKVVGKINPWTGIAYGLANLAISEVTPSVTIFKGGGWAVSISPVAMFTYGVASEAGGAGVGKWSSRLGAGVSVSKKIGDWTLVAGGDLSSQNRKFGGVAFGGAAYDDGECGISMIWNYYAQKDKQFSGVLGVRYDEMRLSFEDDFFAIPFTGFKPLDRYRTAAIEIQYGNLIVGVNVYTNDVGPDAVKLETTRSKHKIYKDGCQLSSPIYFGYKKGNSVVRYGINNSEGGYLGQNWWHRNVFKSADFDFGLYDDPFMQIGTYKPYTLY